FQRVAVGQRHIDNDQVWPGALHRGRKIGILRPRDLRESGLGQFFLQRPGAAVVAIYKKDRKRHGWENNRDRRSNRPSAPINFCAKRALSAILLLTYCAA